MKHKITIRPYTLSDDMATITQLVNRAYKALKDEGMNYLAASQGIEITRSRIEKSYLTLLALDQDKIIGTLSLYAPKPSDHCEWYNRPYVAKFGQFAVDPAYQKQGIGTQLLLAIEAEAKVMPQVKALALDTSEHAHHLIAYYDKMGYKKVQTVDWEVTNYISLVMSKSFEST